MAESSRFDTQFRRLADDELLRLAHTDFVPEARAALLKELQNRGLTPVATPVLENPTIASPYATPLAALADAPREPASLSVSGLIRLFQYMVVASAVIGLFLAISGYLPFRHSPEIESIRDLSGAGAIFFEGSIIVYYITQFLYLVAAIGLYFFVWWSRYLFSGIYFVGLGNVLAGGIVVLHSWEYMLGNVATLLDGAVLVLSFLPPLSRYFARAVA